MIRKNAGKAGRRFWTITVWDSTSPVFQKIVPKGSITEVDLGALIKTLAAKHGLTDEETVACYFARRTKARSALLEIRRDHTPAYTLTCGENPHVTAVVTDATGRPLRAGETP